MLKISSGPSVTVPYPVLLRLTATAATSVETRKRRTRIADRAVEVAISLSLMVAGGAGLASLAQTAPSSDQHAPPSAQSVVAQPYTLARSLPTHIEIADIGVSADIIELGKNSDGSMETPGDYTHAGWYKYSPTPGEIGPAIITGHVDNYLGPAVFFYLKDLRPGQLIDISRQDGSTAHFRVDDTKVFDQTDFPTDEVYGNIDYAGLRLITCGGLYNPLTNHYSHNTVVYASFVR